MRAHAAAGAAIVARVPSLAGLAPAIRSHHERWDGQGYPDGLAGAAIPLGARIVAVADAVDAIMTDRPYHSGQPWRRALAEVAAGSGSQFAPEVAEALLALARAGALDD